MKKQTKTKVAFCVPPSLWEAVKEQAKLDNRTISNQVEMLLTLSLKVIKKRKELLEIINDEV